MEGVQTDIMHYIDVLKVYRPAFLQVRNEDDLAYEDAVADNAFELTHFRLNTNGIFTGSLIQSFLLSLSRRPFAGITLIA